ncbi:MAG: tetratricopeptide repeat protein [Bacteroidota bacterium]
MHYTDKYLDIILSAISEFESLENYPFCLQILNTCIEHYPDYAELYQAKGYIHYVQGKQESAIEEFNKAIQLQKKSDFFGYRGKAFYELGEFNKAITDFSKALELEKSHSWFYWRALTLTRVEYDGKAIEDFTEAIKLLPYDTGSYFLRAQSYFKMMDFEKSFADLDKCIEINPEHNSAKKLKQTYLEIKPKLS